MKSFDKLCSLNSILQQISCHTSQLQLPRETLSALQQWIMTYLRCNESSFSFCPVRFDIKALTGRGIFSQVFCVEHRVTCQPFTIKMTEVEAPEDHEVSDSQLAGMLRMSRSHVIQLIKVFQFSLSV